MLLMTVSLLFAGCLDAIGMGDETADVAIDVVEEGETPLSGEEVEAILTDENLMNLTALAAAEEKFKVEIYVKQIQEGELVEMTYILGKDDAAQLAETGIKVQSGMMGLEYSVVSGASTDVNIKVGNQWFLARDEVPEYIDPFADLMDDSGGDEQQMPTGEENDYEDMFQQMASDYDDLQIDFTGLNWTVTMDAISLQQVATASNDTHSFMLELLEAPPRIHELQIDSHDGNEATKLTMIWGEEAALTVSSNHPKTSVDLALEEVDSIETENVFICDNNNTVPWDFVNDDEDDCGDNSDEGVDPALIPQNGFICDNNNTVPWDSVNDNWDDCGDNSDEGVDPALIPEQITTFREEISEEQINEVANSDIEMRIGTEVPDDAGEEVFLYNLSMNLADGTANQTDASGAWWDMIWVDADNDGYVSAGDYYTVTTNSSGEDEMIIRFYDNWSMSYEGGPLPGFEIFLLLGALALAALRRNFSL